MVLAKEQKLVVKRWLDYARKRLTEETPTGNIFVLVTQEDDDTLLIRSLTGTARFTLIACSDDTVDGGKPIYPQRQGVTPIGDGRWK